MKKNIDKLKDILCTYPGSFAVRKDTGEVVKCDLDIGCDECKFCTDEYYCHEFRRKWLDAEYKEPKAPEIDWSKVPVDTPILVWQGEGIYKNKRHFAKYENGEVYAWTDGMTSYTVDKDNENYVTLIDWEHAEIAPGIDCSEWYKED